MRARAAVAALAVVAMLLVPTSTARAESILWTLVASPLAVTTGVETHFTFTATNEDPTAAVTSNGEIGCIALDVPVNFSVVGAVVLGSSAGSSWHADPVEGNRVTTHTDSGGDRLAFLDWVTFKVTATALGTGSLAWTAKAHRQQDCSSVGALLGVPPVVVVTGPAATPSPSPPPPPSPTPSQPPPPPTPSPTPRPPLPSVPLPSLPSVLPSLPIETAPPTQPSTTSPTASPRASDAGVPEPSPSPSGPAGTVTRPSAGSGQSPVGGENAAVAPPAGRQGGETPAIRFDDARLQMGLGAVGLLAGFDVWAVPAATIAAPGLLVILWVALQAVGATAWLPAARRLRDGAAGKSRSTS